MSAKFLPIALLLAAANLAADELIAPQVSRLKLRPQALVQGDAVRLADVLEFDEADPRLSGQIADATIVTGLAPPTQVEITYHQIGQRLTELRVNAARVLVSGPLQCRVALEAPPPLRTSEAAPEPDPGRERERADRPRASQSSVPLNNAARTTTLADAIRAHVSDGLADLGGTVEIDFELAGREHLELTSPPDEFTIRSPRGRRLGLREFSVQVRRDGRVQRTVQIAGRVRLVRQVVVAEQPLNVGSYVQAERLGTATRVFTEDGDFGLTHAEAIVGQQVRGFVRAGEMVRSADVKPVDLVERSRPVTVVGEGPVRLRVTGVALESGGYGDTVRVRLGEARKDRREVRGVVSGPGTVRLAAAGP